MNDDLADVMATRPTVEPLDAETLERERARLLQFIASTPTSPASPGPRARRRSRRRWAIPGVAVAALLTAAAGWAVTRHSAETTVVSCRDGNVIKAVSGDPVADCAAQWKALFGTDAPPLVGYETSDGNAVVVLAATDPVPDGWRRLGAGFRQDQTAIELDAALADAGTGLGAPRCLTGADASTVVARVLSDHHVNGWAVQVESPDADGSTTCTGYVLDADNHTISLRALESSRSEIDPAIVQFIAAARQQVDGACLDLKQATKQLRSIGAELGINETSGALSILPVKTPDAPCSTTEIELGGHLMVTVRGPSPH